MSARQQVDPLDNKTWKVLARVVSGRASETDEQAIKAWRAQSAENEATYRDAKRLWTITGPIPKTIPPPPDLLALRGRADRRLLVKRRRTHGLVAAAAALAALAIGVQTWNPPRTAPPTAARTLNLSDGSLARLAPGALVTFEESESRRVATLKGKAFFAVHHDAQRPFYVSSGSGEIQVLGTRFQAVSEADGLSTTVVDGLVSLTALGSDSTVVVEPGYTSTVRARSVPSTPVSVGRGTLAQNWSNLLLFSDTRLRDALDEVELHFGVEVRVSSEGAADLPVTADFSDQPVEQIVQTLCATVRATCRISSAPGDQEATR